MDSYWDGGVNEIIPTIREFVALALGICATIIVQALYARHKYCGILYYRVSEYPHYRAWKDKLTAINIAVWNGGRRVIRKEDIAQPGILTLQTSQKSMFTQVLIKYRTNPRNIFDVSLDNVDQSIAKVSFDYLNQGDGGVIECIYKGDSLEDCKLMGDVKGGIGPKRVGPMSIAKELLAFFPLSFLCIAATAEAYVWLQWRIASQDLVKLLAVIFGSGLYFVIIMPIRKLIRSRRTPHHLLESLKMRPTSLDSSL